MTKHLEVYDMETIETQIRKSIEPIKITNYALDKSNYLVRRVNELAEKPLEVAFLLLDDPEKQKEEGIIIRDVYIGHDQDVRDDHFIITGSGMITSLRDIYNNLKKKPIGVGHSHPIMGAFFSPEDKGSLKDILRDGIYSEKDLQIYSSFKDKVNDVPKFKKIENNNFLFIKINEDEYYIGSEFFDLFKTDVLFNSKMEFYHKEKIIVPYSIGMVSNTRNDFPFCGLAYKIGDNKKILEDIKIDVIEKEKQKTLDKDLIDYNLIERVIYLRNKYEHLIMNTKQINSDYFIFEKIKKYFIEIINGLTESDKKDKDVELDFKKIDGLYGIIIKFASFYTKYDIISKKRISAKQFNPKLEDLLRELNSFKEYLLSKNQFFYDKINFLKSICDNLNFLQKNRIKKMELKCSSIITLINRMKGE